MSVITTSTVSNDPSLSKEITGGSVTCDTLYLYESRFFFLGPDRCNSYGNTRGLYVSQDKKSISLLVSLVYLLCLDGNSVFIIHAILSLVVLLSSISL